LALERIIANVTGKLRRGILFSREHIIVPLSLVVPGVLNGSQGKLFYPLEELQKDPAVWNGMPLMAYHPKQDGQFVSARSPEVLNSQCLGTVLNAEVNGKLSAEGWFDVDNTRRIDPRILLALESGDPIELSTGLFTKNEPAEEGAEHNGEAFDFIARDHKPDHVAVLFDKVGACSLDDGCGVGVNESKDKKSKKNKKDNSQGEEATENEHLSGGEQLSHQDIRTELQNQLQSRFTQEDPSVWVEEVFDDFIIFSQAGELFSLGYSRFEDSVQLDSSDPIKVKRETSFVAVNQKEGEADMALNATQKKELVDDLITNCECWEEDDRKTLNGLNDDKLEKVSKQSKSLRNDQAVANAAREGFEDPGGQSHVFNEETSKWETKAKPEEEEVVANEKSNKPMTTEEWLNDANAPAEVRAIVGRAITNEQQQKEQLIANMIKDVADADKAGYAERFRVMSVNDLTDFAKLMAPTTETVPTPNFFGQSTPAHIVGNDIDADDVLPQPTINWEEEAKKST